MLIFGVGVGLDLGQVGMLGQGRRSKVKVKSEKCVWIPLCDALILPQGQVQRSRSKSKISIKVKHQGHVSG